MENKDEIFLDNFTTRLTELRTNKNVSAREMSLAIGQSPGYINKIENHKMVPSLTGFISICEYLNVTPRDFFNYYETTASNNLDLFKTINHLPKEKRLHLELLIQDLE